MVCLRRLQQLYDTAGFAMKPRQHRIHSRIITEALGGSSVWQLPSASSIGGRSSRYLISVVIGRKGSATGLSDPIRRLGFQYFNALIPLQSSSSISPPNLPRFPARSHVAQYRQVREMDPRSGPKQSHVRSRLRPQYYVQIKMRMRLRTKSKLSSSPPLIHASAAYWGDSFGCG